MFLISHISRRVYSSMANKSIEPGTFSIAFVTVPDMTVAKKIAHGLVKEKLAGCVQIVPGMTSVYEWEGAIEEDSELLLVAKTRTSRVEDLSTYVRSNHPYDVCQVTTTLINGGNPPYLEWLSKLVP